MSKLRLDGTDYRATPLLRFAAFAMLGSNVAILPILIYLAVHHSFMLALPIHFAAGRLLPMVIGIYIGCNIVTRILWRRQEMLPSDAPTPDQGRFNRAA